MKKPPKNTILSYLGAGWNHEWYINENTEQVYMKTSNDSYIILSKKENKEDIINMLLEGELERRVKE